MTTKSRTPRKIVPIRQLGHGAVAEVMLVEVDGHRAALKRALAQFRGNPNVARLLREEAEVGRKLRHPAIPRLIDELDDEHGVALLFEVIDGVTLAESLETAPDAWTPGEISHVVTPVLSALEHAHDKGIVHRDVNPRNVMLARTGDAVLIDFGIALIEDRARWTAAGAKRGTLGYQSPEALREEPVDARADLFAVGSLVYRLLFGKPAFTGKGPLLLMNAIAEARVELPATATTAAKHFCAKTLTRDPAHRFASAAECKRALDDVVKASPDARHRVIKRVPAAVSDEGAHPRTKTK